MSSTRVSEVRSAHDALRAEVWPALREVAVPDPLLGFAFDDFIADFAGSPACVEQLRALAPYRAAHTVFITPDGSTAALRAAALADGKTLLVTTFGIADGFRRVRPDDLPDGGPRQAATMEWLTQRAPEVALADLAGADVGVLVTGAGAITRGGLRLGKGHGYFDLEWAMLSEVGGLAPEPLVVGVVHDCQVVDAEVPAAAHDVPVDVVLTGTRTLTSRVAERPTGRVDWSLLSDDRVRRIPPLVDLALLQLRQRS